MPEPVETGCRLLVPHQRGIDVVKGCRDLQGRALCEPAQKILRARAQPEQRPVQETCPGTRGVAYLRLSAPQGGAINVVKDNVEAGIGREFLHLFKQSSRAVASSLPADDASDMTEGHMTTEKQEFQVVAARARQEELRAVQCRLAWQGRENSRDTPRTSEAFLRINADAQLEMTCLTVVVGRNPFTTRTPPSTRVVVANFSSRRRFEPNPYRRRPNPSLQLWDTRMRSDGFECVLGFAKLQEDEWWIAKMQVPEHKSPDRKAFRVLGFQGLYHVVLSDRKAIQHLVEMLAITE